MGFLIISLFYTNINSRNLVYSYTLSTRLPSLLGRLKCLTVVVSAYECQHRDKYCKSSVSIAIMSWHVHKNIVMWAVNLYSKFAWAQENFDVGG